MKKNVQCVTPQDTVQFAARTMRDNNVGFLPVCDDSNTVVGTLTDRDLAVRLVAENKPNTTAVHDVMSREVVGCNPQDELQRAEELMGQRHKSRIVCIDAKGKLLGVISLADIAQYDTKNVAKTIQEVSRREARPS